MHNTYFRSNCIAWFNPILDFNVPFRSVYLSFSAVIAASVEIKLKLEYAHWNMALNSKCAVMSTVFQSGFCSSLQQNTTFRILVLQVLRQYRNVKIKKHFKLTVVPCISSSPSLQSFLPLKFKWRALRCAFFLRGTNEHLLSQARQCSRAIHCA